MFQDPHGSFDPRHRAGRIVAEPLHLLGGEITASGRERMVADALVEVGLSPDDAHKYPHEFSGGQRQRLAIARALITRPELIVLDEPVSALDVSIRAQVLDLLADLQARLGLTYLFISHDLAVIRAITDRVLVMQKGRIVEEGATSQVLDAPKHAYSRALVASALHLDKVLAERKSRLSVPNQRKLSTFLASSGVNRQYSPASFTGPAEMGVPDHKPEFGDPARKAAGMPHLPSVWDGPMIAPKIEAVPEAVSSEATMSTEFASEVNALALGESREELALEEQIARAEEVAIAPPPVRQEQNEPWFEIAPAREAVLIDAANMAYFEGRRRRYSKADQCRVARLHPRSIA